jgi:hypothetical protein
MTIHIKNIPHLLAFCFGYWLAFLVKIVAFGWINSYSGIFFALKRWVWFGFLGWF